MLKTEDFGTLLKARQFNFFSGVPCSFLTNLINYAINDLTYIGAANEGDAVAIAAGATLGGRKACVLFQNSGLGNAVSPLTSLIHTFKIPILGFVTLRGEPGLKDEPQHELMGTITEKMLDLMEIEWDYLSDDIHKVDEQLDRVNSCYQEGKSFFFVVKKNTFDSISLSDQPTLSFQPPAVLCSKEENSFPERLDVLKRISQLKKSNTVLLATTGKTGRELCCGVEDSKQHLYMVGSMGCIGSLGLGLAISQPEKEIISIDGDGALLMRMGNLATIGAYKPRNLCHIILDNNTHDSTGGQKTVSDALNIPDLAIATGYSSVCYAHSMEEVQAAILRFRQSPKLTAIYLKTTPGSAPNIGRPEVKPHQVSQRLKDFIND